MKYLFYILKRYNLFWCLLYLFLNLTLVHAKYWEPTFLTSVGTGLGQYEGESVMNTSLATRYELSKSTSLSAEYLLHWSRPMKQSRLAAQRLHLGVNYRFDLLQAVPWVGVTLDALDTIDHSSSIRFAPAMSLGLDYLWSEQVSFTVKGHYTHQAGYLALLYINYRFLLVDQFDQP